MDDSFYKKVHDWGDDEVSKFLVDHNCSVYVHLFKSNDIKGDNILDVDQHALKEMGVNVIGDRVRIAVAINGLRNKCFDELVWLEQYKKSNRPQPPARLEDFLAKRKQAQTRPPPLVLEKSSSPTLPNVYQSTMSNNDQNLKANGKSQNDKYNAKNALAALGVPVLKRPRGNSAGTKDKDKDKDPPLFTSAPLPPVVNTSSNISSKKNNLLNLSSGSIKRPSTSNNVSNKKLNYSINRPSTANPSIHTFAKSQISPTESVREEMFENGYRIGAGPYQHNNSKLSLTDVRRKCVKFITANDGFTRVLDVSECDNASQVFARVLKKFGKLDSYSKQSINSNDNDNDKSYFVYNGWAMFRCVDHQIYGYPLNENEIIAVCQSSPDDPQRERGLYIQKIDQWQLPKSKSRKKFEAFFTEKPKHSKDKINKHSPILSKQSEPSSVRNAKKTNRASMMSVMSGLGAVPEYESGISTVKNNLDLNLTNVNQPHTQLPSVIQAGIINNPRSGRLQNFHGQRPPSELISTHLADFFPTADIKSVKQTARNSRIHRRDSSNSTIHSRPIWESEPMPELPIPPSKYLDKLPQQKLPPSHNIPPTPDQQQQQQQQSNIIDNRPSEMPPTLPPVNVEPLDWSEEKQYLNLRPSSIMSKKNNNYNNVKDDTSSILTMDQVVAEVENRQSSEDPNDDNQIDEESLYDKNNDYYNNENEDEHENKRNDDDENNDDENNVNDDIKSEKFSTNNFKQSVELPLSNSASAVESTDQFMRRPSVGLGPGLDDPDNDEYVLTDDDDDRFSFRERKPIKWHKGALIGSGSFGSVFLGMNKSTGLLMAVKQVDLPNGSASIEPRKKSMLDALEREIELLKVLKHKNIVQYLDSSLDQSCLNIFLEYVPGGSVAALLSNYGAFEEELVRNFVKQILTGLNYLHERGIIHRDIKGANILVDNKGGVKISDFGISKKKVTNDLLGNASARQSLQGSVFWMAPEVVKQEPYTRKADIWSLGCLVVEMLTGSHPFPSLNQMQAIFKIGSSVTPEIPEDITAEAHKFLSLTFEIKSAARPSAAELLRESFITGVKRNVDQQQQQSLSNQSSVALDSNTSSQTLNPKPSNDSSIVSNSSPSSNPSPTIPNNNNNSNNEHKNLLSINTDLNNVTYNYDEVSPTDNSKTFGESQY